MKVKLYSINTCFYCELAKDFLRKHNINFEEINVEEDQEAIEKLVKKSGQTGVPVIEIGKEIIIGFDKERLKRALRLK